MFGALFRIGHQLFRESLRLLHCFSPRSCSRDRADGVTPSRRRTRISGLDPTMAKSRKGKMIEERGGVEAAQRAIERERAEREGPAEALTWHDLENIASANVFLRALDNVEILGVTGVRLNLSRRRRRVPAPGSGQPECRG